LRGPFNLGAARGLTEEQKRQFKQRKQALRAKVKAAMQATAPKDV